MNEEEEEEEQNGISLPPLFRSLMCPPPLRLAFIHLLRGSAIFFTGTFSVRDFAAQKKHDPLIAALLVQEK